MIFWAVDLAVYRRLTGAPLDQQGRPLLDSNGVPTNRHRVLPPDHGGGTGPSYGVRVPVMRHPHEPSRGLTSCDQTVRGSYEQFSKALRNVPIFDENVSGRKWVDTWPCVTFRWNGQQPDPSVYTYFDTIITEDMASTPIQLVNADGDVIQSGYEARYERPNPESYKVQYVITAQAKSQAELGFICAQIVYLFPQRGALQVEWASGEIHTCDMLYLTSMALDAFGDDITPGVGADEQRGFKRAFVYEVEGYLDNTTNDYGTNDLLYNSTLIYERILELGDIQERMMRACELNSLELEPLG